MRDISAALDEYRPSAIVAIKPRGAGDAIEALDTLVQSLGFKGIGSRWQKIDSQSAASLLTRVLQYDLAYSSSVEMDPSQAEVVANEFVRMLPGPVEYFTNGKFSDGGWAGHKVAPGTGETGVVCLNSESAAILWVQDED